MAPEPPLSQCRQGAEWFFGLAFSGAVLRSSRGAAVETRSLWTVRMLRTNWPAIFKLCQVDSVTMFSVDGCRILVHADLIGSSVTLFGTLVVWIDRNGAGTIQGLVYPPHKTVHGSKEWPRTAERLLFRVFPWWIVELHVSLHQIGTSPHVVDYFFLLWPTLTWEFTCVLTKPLLFVKSLQNPSLKPRARCVLHSLSITKSDGSSSN
jgi:hypothetical protein